MRHNQIYRSVNLACGRYTAVQFLISVCIDRSKFRIQLDGGKQGQIEAARPGRLILHTGACAEVILVEAVYSSATQMETPIRASEFSVWSMLSEC